MDGQQAYNYGIVNEAVYQNESGDAAYESALELAMKIVPNVRYYIFMFHQLCYLSSTQLVYSLI